MAFTPENDVQASIAAEIGLTRYEAVCHFLIDGNYKADHEEDFAAAFAEYVNAWSMLVTTKARRLGGIEILEAISLFAARSGQPELVEEADRLVASYQLEVKPQERGL